MFSNAQYVNFAQFTRDELCNSPKMKFVPAYLLINFGFGVIIC